MTPGPPLLHSLSLNWNVGEKSWGFQAMSGWGRAVGVWRPRTGAEGVTERAFCCHHPLRFTVEMIMRRVLQHANQTKITSWHQPNYDQFWTVHTVASLIPETPSDCHFSLPLNCSDEWLLQTGPWSGFCDLMFTSYAIMRSADEERAYATACSSGLIERMRVCILYICLD